MFSIQFGCWPVDTKTDFYAAYLYFTDSVNSNNDDRMNADPNASLATTCFLILWTGV